MREKRIAIMQPYFYPYIGYFHLLHSVDCFVLYDNLKYTKKGWINRNRFLSSGTDAVFSIPLRKASDSLNIDRREIAPDFDRRKLLNRVRSAYSKAPHFQSAMALFEQAIGNRTANLYGYIKQSLVELCQYLGIETEIIDSSSVSIDHSFRGQDKVLAICETLSAGTYVNAIGGMELYRQESFQSLGIGLRFIKSELRPYPQFDHPFVPWLSILDVLMFNSREWIQDYLAHGYSLVGEMGATQ